MTRIVLLENIHPSAVEIFKASGFDEIVAYPSALARDDLLAAVSGATVLGIRSRTQVDSEILAAASSLRAIGCFCIGTNQVNTDEAMLRGIPVFNAPFSNTRSVAELVIAETIMLLRRIPEKNARVHAGFWDKTADGAYEARGKTLGIIGYGNIGSQVGTLAESLGMRVIFHDVEAKLPLGNARPAGSLKKLLAQSDVVTLHVPGGKSTQNLINTQALATMKRGAILINASRGTVVDIKALHDAIKDGHISGAALDVFPVEPKSRNEPLDSPLRGMPNVILTPHIGGSTEESQENIGKEVAEKLVQYLRFGTTKSAVNFPEISYQPKSGASRLLHIHKNLPGALSAVSSVLAGRGLNVVGQHLQTKGPVGYVICDVEGDLTDQVIDELRAEPVTIRCERTIN